MTREPAVIVSTLTAFLTAAIGFAVAFGFDFSDEQREALIGGIAPLVAVIFLLGPAIRAFVYSKESAKEESVVNYEKGARGETPTRLIADEVAAPAR